MKNSKVNEMFLDYIEITNFRPYYDTQTINFGYDEQKNLTVIIADNGSGKTALVNALTWCLYDEELHDVRDKSEPLYNMRAAQEAEENDGELAEVLVKVKIRFYYFEDSRKKYFTVTRELNYQKWGNAAWNAEYKSRIIVDETDKKSLEDTEANNAINSKIPKDMFQYFFFNGATLANYFNNDGDLTLKTSIEDISQIDLIKDIKEHLKGTYDKLANQLKKKNSNSDINYDVLINKKMKEKSSLIEKREENQKQYDIAITNITKLEKKLEDYDSDHIKKLEKRRKELKSTLKSIKESISNDTAEYESLILELYPITIFFDELTKSANIFDKARNKKQAPPLIENELLEDILEDGYCICGLKLDEHPECIEELEKRLKKNTKVKTDTFFEEYYQIKQVLSKLKKIPDINKLRKTIEENENTKSVLENQLEEISRELSNNDLEDVAEYEKQLKNNEKAKKEYADKNKEISSKIHNLNDKIAAYKDKRAKAGELEGELMILRNKIQFAESALEIIMDLKSNVQDHIRTKVNNKTREQFTNINWANNKYVDVTIDSKYNITITKSSNQKVTPGDLSDGESNLLALSFMMALHSLSGFEIPLIIDAPFEKLDKGKRIDFISNLHDFTADKQIVFLFTDAQYTDDVRAHMLKNIISEYGLKPYENKTEIVNYG